VLAVVIAVVMAVVLLEMVAGSWMELLEIAAAVMASISLLHEAHSGQLFTL